MIKESIEIVRYEVGDVVDVTGVRYRSAAKAKLNADCKRGVIGNVTPLRNGYTQYVLYVDSGKRTLILTPSEQDGMKYIGHIDMEMLFGHAEA